jgi:carbon storage regulator
MAGGTPIASHASQSQRATAVARATARATRFPCKDKEFSNMLVLSRKVGERIHVGDDVVLEIRRIAGNRVTLALDAPRHVRILRGELELAAREFRPRTSDSPAPRLAMPVPAHAPLLDQAPAAPVCRTCAT